MRTLICGLYAGLHIIMAQAHPEDQAAPCQAEAFRQFDFWLGDWRVTSPDGTLAGTNRITLEAQGCLLTEHWTGASGASGQSYNYYNPARQVWRQVWISPGAMIDIEGGLSETGNMSLEGWITDPATHARAPFRGLWTPYEDGTVLQRFEQYDRQTEAWTLWFSGLYTPAQADAE